jgi:putative FmdB family regulatory protein
MPIFEFKCARCEKKFDVLFRSQSDKPKMSCPKCGCKNAKKQFSVFGMSRGGSGGDYSSASSSSGSSCSGCSKSSCGGCHH